MVIIRKITTACFLFLEVYPWEKPKVCLGKLFEII